mgnify:CR=1 FL=1
MNHNPENIPDVGEGYRLVTKKELVKMLDSGKTMPGLEMCIGIWPDIEWISACGDSNRITYRVPR